MSLLWREIKWGQERSTEIIGRKIAQGLEAGKKKGYPAGQQLDKPPTE